MATLVLNNVEKVLRKANLNFYLENGFSQEEAERLADEKIIKVRKLSRSKDIVKF